MAFIGDMKNIVLRLKLTNYAEGLDHKPRHHVRQISFCVSVLEEDVGGADENLDYGRPWSAEDQEALKWQPRTGNWQNDFEVRDTMTNLSGKLCQGLCPDNKLGFSLFGKVSDSDTHQTTTEPQSLSSFRHVSFYSVMLTKHSVSNEQDVQLLFSRDGLPEDRSCLRWRSHDYIKLVLSDAKPFYTVFWLVQWDVVDLMHNVNDGLAATDPGTGLGMNPSSLCLDPSILEHQSEDHPQKFSGIRFRKKRKSPWSAEVKPRGSAKNKISVGCYRTAAEAARAADAGRYYYNLNLEKLNFPDSVRILDEIEVPPNLDEEAKKAFVQKQAHWLAELAEMPPPTGIFETRSCITNPGGFPSRNISSANNFGVHNMRPVTNVSFAGSPTARPKDFATTSMDSGSDLQANLVGVRPSTSFGSGVLPVPVARSSPEESLSLITSSNRFTTNSLVSAANFHHELEPKYTHEASFAPVRNSNSGETTNDFFIDTDWDENPEQNISDVSARIRASENPSVGVSHSNHFGLHHETESQTTNLASAGYDWNPLLPGSEQAQFHGEYARRDFDIFDLDEFF